MHLSRVLSPVMEVLTPSLFAVRAPLLEPPAAAGGTDEAEDALRGGAALLVEGETARFKKKRGRTCGFGGGAL